MIDYTRYKNMDVVVVGGGMAGIAAAIASARAGSQTMLIEQAGWLGGMGITGATGLHTFFNIYGAWEKSERFRVVGGIAQELIDRVVQRGGAVGHVPMERGADFISMITPVEPETFKVAAVDLCLEAGVKLLFHTTLDEVRASQGHIDGIIVWNKAGRSLIRAKQFIDCTGDGDLAAYAGARFEVPAPGNPGAYSAGFTFRLVNVDLQKLEADLERRNMITQIAHAIKPWMNQPELIRLGIDMRSLHESGEVNTPAYFLSTSMRPREITYCNCINYGPNNGLDVDALTMAEITLRRQMHDVAELFRRNFSGCEQAYPAGPAPSVGQRRGRAIHCLYELTEQDCVTGRKFDDQIGLFSFIDRSGYLVKDAGAYGIPYRALIPVGLDNVFIAGRMMSIDWIAHSSTRNTVACLIGGQGAGTGAALAAHQGIANKDVEINVLQAMLKQEKVILEPQLDPL
jgi:hypothetical protein